MREAASAREMDEIDEQVMASLDTANKQMQQVIDKLEHLDANTAKRIASLVPVTTEIRKEHLMRRSLRMSKRSKGDRKPSQEKVQASLPGATDVAAGASSSQAAAPESSSVRPRLTQPDRPDSPLSVNVDSGSLTDSPIMVMR